MTDCQMIVTEAFFSMAKLNQSLHINKVSLLALLPVPIAAISQSKIKCEAALERVSFV